MAIDRQDSPYRRGTRYDVMPIPMVPEHCIAVDAGPVQLVVESRRLTNEILDATYAPGEIDEAEVDFDDHGATVHVCGPDGLEHLRFDCFEFEPHYHYIEQAGQTNVVVRIDEVAVGDPTAFTLRCLRERLPDMLANAGATDLADALRSDPSKLAAAVDETEALMARAAAPAGEATGLAR
jgi:hypothetical protein